ncbi:MAG: hypothetical protein H6727_13725 [Myxococcales bacterium]|nr:hypothetical protein [Myxococcales bacterium]
MAAYAGRGRAGQRLSRDIGLFTAFCDFEAASSLCGFGPQNAYIFALLFPFGALGETVARYFFPDLAAGRPKKTDLFVFDALFATCSFVFKAASFCETKPFETLAAFLFYAFFVAVLYALFFFKLPSLTSGCFTAFLCLQREFDAYLFFRECFCVVRPTRQRKEEKRKKRKHFQSGLKKGVCLGIHQRFSLWFCVEP